MQRMLAIRGFSILIPVLFWQVPPTLAQNATEETQQEAAQESDTADPAAEFYATATVVGEESVSSATASVDVIDREMIEGSGMRTVAELLGFVPGIDVNTTSTRGGLSSIQMRGGDPNFTLVLLDGVPVNDTTNSNGGDVFNLESLPASAVERIEIVRGPLSSVFGSTGLSGVVNIITAAGQAGPTGLGVELEGGGPHFFRGTGSASGGDERTTWFVGLSWEEDEERIAEESFEQLAILGNLGVVLSERAHWRLNTRFTSWQADDYRDGSAGPFLGSGELRHTNSNEFSLGSRFALDGHRFTAAFYHLEAAFDNPAVVPAFPSSVEDVTFTRGRLGWAAALYSGEKVEFNAGADVQWEEGVHHSVLILPPNFGGAVRGDYEVSRTTPGAYVELIARHKNVVFELGARVDFPESKSTEVNPRLGINVRPRGGPTAWHASVGRAFKLPGFFVVASPRLLGGNPDLLPETAWGADLGVEHTFEAANVRLGLTLFSQRYRNLIGFDFGSFAYINRSKVEADGVEFSVSWEPLGRLAVHANATWQDVDDPGSDEPLRLRREWSGGLRILWRPSPQVHLELHTRALSGAFDMQPPAPGRDSIAGYGVVGLAGSWNWSPQWTLKGRLDNLTDREYETRIGFPGAERSVRLALSYTWPARPR